MQPQTFRQLIWELLKQIKIFMLHETKLIELEGETDKSTRIVGDFNTSISLIDRWSSQNIKNIVDLSYKFQTLYLNKYSLGCSEPLRVL